MAHSSKHIAALLYRHMNGTITNSEAEELQSWSAASPENQRLLAELTDETDLAELILFNETYERDDIRSSLYKSIQAQIDFPVDAPTTIVPTIRPMFRRQWWVAASVLLLLGIGAYVWNIHKTPPGLPAMQQTGDLPPGKEGAILTLADGSQVSLDTVQNATIASQGGVTAKVVNGALMYEGSGHEVVYNTMRTPKGRQFHVTLPDGTKVWLNSQSAIRFPTHFAGGERKVDIEGEAYFEVTRNSNMPFKVAVRDQAMVEVLGTAFNINAYDNEPQIATTLVEGSVKVAEQQGSASPVILQPGEQARVPHHDATSIELLRHPDIDKALAWKNGQFYFDGATLPEIMRQVERWYDIEVVYPDKVPPIVFVGKMTRGVTLRFLLRSMEDLRVRYRLEGKVLTILP